MGGPWESTPVSTCSPGRLDRAATLPSDHAASQMHQPPRRATCFRWRIARSNGGPIENAYPVPVSATQYPASLEGHSARSPGPRIVSELIKTLGAHVGHDR